MERCNYQRKTSIVPAVWAEDALEGFPRERRVRMSADAGFRAGGIKDIERADPGTHRVIQSSALIYSDLLGKAKPD